MEFVRYAVVGLFAYALAVTCSSWLLRSGKLNRFGPSAKMLRRISDPPLKAIEGWLLRRGANPQHAERWLLGGVVAGGILVVSLGDWLLAQFVVFGSAGRAGPRAIARVVIFYAGQIVIWSIFIRVIGSWFGAGRYNPLMKPFYFLTDWIVEPLRKRIPPVGMIDISPIVAWFGLQIILSMILRAL